MAIVQNRGIFPDSGVGGGDLPPINPTGTNTAMPGSNSALGAGGASFPVNTAVPQYTPQQLGMSAIPDASKFTTSNGYSLSKEAAQALLHQQQGSFNQDQLTYLNNQINGLSGQDAITQQLASSNPQIVAALQQQGIPINSQNVDNYIWQNPQYQTPEWRAQQQHNFGGATPSSYAGAGYTTSPQNTGETGDRGIIRNQPGSQPRAGTPTDTSGSSDLLSQITNTGMPSLSGSTTTPPSLVGDGTIDGTGTSTGTATGFGNFSTGLPTSGVNNINIGELLGKGADTAGLVSSLDNLFGKGVGSTVAAFLQNGAGYNPDVVTALTNAFEPYKEEGLASIKQNFGATGASASSASALAQEKFLRDLALGDQSILAGQYNNSVSNYAGMLNNTLSSAAAEQANKLNPLDYLNGILGALSSTGLLSKIPGLNNQTATGGSGTGGNSTATGGNTNIYIDSNGQVKVQPPGSPGASTGTTQNPTPPKVTLPPGTPPTFPPSSSTPTQPKGTVTSTIGFNQQLNDQMLALGIDPSSSTADWFSGLDPGFQDYLSKNPSIFSDIDPQRFIETGDNNFNNWLQDPNLGPMLPEDPGVNGMVSDPNSWQWNDPGNGGDPFNWDNNNDLNINWGDGGGDYQPGLTLE